MATNQLMDSSLELQDELNSVAIPEENRLDIKTIRSEYANKLATAPFNNEDHARHVSEASQTEPILELTEFKPEDLPKRIDLLTMLSDTLIDITTVDHQIINAAARYTDLISQTISRLNTTKQRLARNKQRMEDINFLTNAYKGIGNVILINDSNTTGDYTFSNNVFCGEALSEKIIPCIVTSVTGNGYVGNSHVMNGDDYLEKTEDRKSLSNITDNDNLTVFEYSRIISTDNGYYQENKIGENVAYDINYDSKDVTCTISLQPKTEGAQINMAKFDFGSSNVKLQDVLISSDGRIYNSALKKEIEFSSDVYHALGHISGCDMICFPATPYVKFVFSSNYIPQGEVLGYDYTDISGDKPRTFIKKIDNAVRKVIQLGGITAYYNTYSDASVLSTNLAPSIGCDAAAIFVNSYIPDSYPSDETPLKYELIVNGISHKVTPINNYSNGTKMVSHAISQYGNSSVKFIDESIKTLQLKITIKASSGAITPFVGNVKVCIG